MISVVSLRRLRRALLGGALFFVLSSCTFSPKYHLYQASGATMGTTYTVKWVAKTGDVRQKEIENAISQRLIDFNQELSTYIADSKISQINASRQANTWLEIEKDTYHVLTLSQKVSQMTQGFFDPTLGPVMALWGFGPNPSQTLPTPSDLKKVRAYVGPQSWSLRSTPRLGVQKNHPQVEFDINAIAKGYGVDVISELLSERFGLQDHLVEIGGEMRARGKKVNTPWKVGIETPQTEGRSVFESIALSHLSLATSGNYRQFRKQAGKVIHHTVNPVTLQPVESTLVSASVLFKECAMADALATSMIAMGKTQALKLAQRHDLSVLLIEQIKGELETTRTGLFALGQKAGVSRD